MLCNHLLNLLLTPAINVVSMIGWIVFTQSSQDQLVVHYPVDRLEQESVKGQIANSLEFKFLINKFQFLNTLSCFLKFHQDFIMFLQIVSKFLWDHRRRSYKDL